MTMPLYERSTGKAIHRGALCAYRPILWLPPPPLLLLRNIHWEQPRHASIHRWDELPDAFRGEYVEEDVMVRGKVRFVVVLSSNNEIQRFKDLLVAPTYSVDPDRHQPRFLDRLRSHRIPHLFHLGRDSDYPEMKECYINLRKIHPIHKDFLTEDSKLEISLTAKATCALLESYRSYLRID